MSKNLMRIASIGGVLSSVVCIGYFILLSSLSFNPFGRYKYLYVGIYAFFFAGTYKIFRDKYNKSYLRPQQAIIMGFLLNIIASFSLGILVYIFLLISGKEGNALEIYTKESLILLENTKEDFIVHYGKQKYEEITNGILNLSLKSLALDQAIGMLLAGFVLTFLFTIIFKH